MPLPCQVSGSSVPNTQEPGNSPPTWCVRRSSLRVTRSNSTSVSCNSASANIFTQLGESCPSIYSGRSIQLLSKGKVLPMQYRNESSPFFFFSERERCEAVPFHTILHNRYSQPRQA